MPLREPVAAEEPVPESGREPPLRAQLLALALGERQRLLLRTDLDGLDVGRPQVRRGRHPRSPGPEVAAETASGVASREKSRGRSPNFGPSSLG